MATEKPRILIVSSRPNAGAGGETYLLSVLRHMDRDRFEPMVLLPSDGNLVPMLTAQGIEVAIAGNDYQWLKPAEPWYKLLHGLQQTVLDISKIIRDNRIALVHTNTNIRLEGAMAARLVGVHHLYLAHIEYQPEMPIFQRFPITQASFAQLMGELSSRVIAVSQSVADTLQPMVPSEKLKVVHNGIELEDIDTAAEQGGSIRADLNLPEDATLVTAVGRMNPDKGFDLFAEAAGMVLQDAGNTHFLLIGGSEIESFEAAVRYRVKELGIQTNFHFLGHRQDVPAILRQSDIFVLSSRREGHPYVMLEAMASGCAVVACTCAGVEETLTDGINGFMVAIDDAEDMAERIQRLVQDIDFRKQMGARARQHIEDCFQASQTADGLMHSYDEILTLPAPLAGAPAIDLFLQAATEISALGSKQIELEDRLRKVERRTSLVFDNPITRGLRTIRNRFSG